MSEYNPYDNPRNCVIRHTQNLVYEGVPMSVRGAYDGENALFTARSIAIGGVEVLSLFRSLVHHKEAFSDAGARSETIQELVPSIEAEVERLIQGGAR